MTVHTSTGTPHRSKSKKHPRDLTATSSDGHGFAGTGHAGTGAGDQIVTRDIPVPVWAGDGYVTGS